MIDVLIRPGDLHDLSLNVFEEVNAYSLNFLLLLGDSEQYLRTWQFEVYVQFNALSTFAFILDVAP